MRIYTRVDVVLAMHTAQCTESPDSRRLSMINLLHSSVRRVGVAADAFVERGARINRRRRIRPTHLSGSAGGAENSASAGGIPLINTVWASGCPAEAHARHRPGKPVCRRHHAGKPVCRRHRPGKPVCRRHHPGKPVCRRSHGIWRGVPVRMMSGARPPIPARAAASGSFAARCGHGPARGLQRASI